ncbi:two-component system phosphate regulon sensor histidine kinase PhoR [Azospirillum lipoferum]|uniref:histidine kinase n=1 Tax=Azospirillum lipoferum TaxID=193 RepID=A0A5A9GV85_AZOLI|nr:MULTISPECIES: ATP-binding protein [Azospirillum]KAA0597642.1 PAS domain-containing protein [Azospirillum lipoferum]MCP1610236.1 two-component system phosphate regulon sensor histidine kinase PhoR [Azospirillum lipoferum]MDW5534271.1 ATP-binding protein [Azospirillum sp. NL1]
MRPKASPPTPLLTAILLMLVPLAGVLVWAVHDGALHGGLALVAGIAALAGAVQVLRTYRGAADAMTDYAGRLAESDEPLAPAGTPPALKALAATIGRLHRVGLRRAESVRMQLDADEAVIDALPAPLLLMDADRQVVRANQTARELFGDKIVDRDLASSLRTPAVLEAVDSVLRGGASRIIEFTLPVPVERSFEAQVKPFQRLVPEPDPSLLDGEIEDEPALRPPTVARMAILTLHDVTAARRSEQMRADFIANASHELRTPLSSLLGFIETLRGPARDDPEAQDRFLAIMHDQASRMTRLVNDLLSLSRIELDEHMPPSGRVDVVEELENVIAALQLKAAERRIRLRLEAPEELPPVVGDEDQLTQVFQNLVSNAIKYTREDTDVTVTVALADGAAVGFTGLPAPGGMGKDKRVGRGGTAMVSVSVRDRGDGIARTHLPRLTERFYRVDAARSRAMGGTGLGLAIVKHILNRHRGRLTIESEVGVGSAFTVYLPAEAPSPPRGEGRGEGEMLRIVPKAPAAHSPHPNPLPGGERGFGSVREG